MSSEADRNFRISIIVDGVDTAAAGAKKVQGGFEGIEKTIGTTSGTGLVKDLTTLKEKQDAQTASTVKATAALKEETAALRENAAAKGSTAGTTIPGAPGLSQDGQDAVARVMADFEKRVAPVKRGLADLKEEASKLEPAVGGADKALLNLVSPGKAASLGNLVKAFGELAGPIALIVGTAKLAQGQVSDLLDEFKDADPESFKAFSEANAGIMALAHPLEAGKGLVRDFFNAMSGGAFDSVAALKAARVQVDDTTKALADLTKQREAESRAFADRQVQDRMAAETREINSQTLAYERLKKEKGAQDSAAEAAAKLEDKRALAGGADPFEVGAGAIDRQTNAQLAALAQEVADARQRLNQAEAREGQLVTELATSKATGQQLLEIQRKLADASQASEEASTDLKSIKVQAEAKRQEIVTGANAVIDDLTSNVARDIQTNGKSLSDQVTKDVEKAIGIVQDAAAKTGQELQMRTKTNFETLQALLKDEVPDAKQSNLIATLVQGIREDAAVRDAAAFQALGGLQDDIREKGRQFEATTAQIRVLFAQTQALSAAIEANSRSAGIRISTNSSPGGLK